METPEVSIQQNPLARPASGLEDFLSKHPIILQLLRFAAIGVINTALDFIILNLLSKFLGVLAGVQLGGLNIISFSLAVVQSYFWNRSWTFGDASASLKTNFIRLMLVGGIGALSVVAVLAGAKFEAGPIFYFVLLLLFLVAELALWIVFGFKFTASANQSQQFINFVIVSIIGLFINSVLVAILSGLVSPSSTLNSDLIKNLAKVGATVASLVWNFLGYKLIVFKTKPPVA